MRCADAQSRASRYEFLNPSRYRYVAQEWIERPHFSVDFGPRVRVLIRAKQYVRGEDALLIHMPGHSGSNGYNAAGLFFIVTGSIRGSGDYEQLLEGRLTVGLLRKCRSCLEKYFGDAAHLVTPTTTLIVESIGSSKR